MLTAYFGCLHLPKVFLQVQIFLTYIVKFDLLMKNNHLGFV